MQDPQILYTVTAVVMACLLAWSVYVNVSFPMEANAAAEPGAGESSSSAVGLPSEAAASAPAASDPRSPTGGAQTDDSPRDGAQG